MIDRERVLDALRSVVDPEVPINVVDLGLIYGIDVVDEKSVKIRMTMTAPQCPMSGYLMQQVEQAVRALPEVKDVSVDLVFDPPWEPSMIKEDALKSIGIGDSDTTDTDGETQTPEQK
ncbi:MAG: metal-sulfur cluster assembly factor [Caldisericota bacterium]|nr:metal-sulfur cluster assembly factor [Caldisericota bacterium]